MRLLAGGEVRIQFRLVPEDARVWQAAHNGEYFLDLRLEVYKGDMATILFLPFHGHEKQPHAGTGDKLERGQIEDQLRWFRVECGRQFCLKVGSRGIVEAAVEGEGDFRLAGVAFQTGIDLKCAHVMVCGFGFS